MSHKHDIATIEEAYRHVFSTPEGEIVLADLMSMHYICKSIFESPDDTPTMVAYREGGKNAVLRILAIAGKSIVAKSE